MKVFISHSWNDKSVATQINEVLQKDKHEVWFDIHRLLPGDPIQGVIDAEIEKADVVVLVWTKNVLSSNGVQEEIKKTLELRKRIIPLQADDTPLNEHPGLKGLLGIPFDDIPTGMLLLQRCLLMLMAAEYKDTSWYKEAFDNVVDLGGYLYYVNTYRLKNGKNSDGYKDEWAARLDELRQKNEYVRQHVMTDMADKMLMLQNIVQRMEKGNVSLTDLKQWHSWCTANESFHPAIVQKLKSIIEQDMTRLEKGGTPVGVLDITAASNTVQRLRQAINQKKDAANSALVQQIKRVAGFFLGDKIIQSIVSGYMKYVTDSPKMLEELLQEAQASSFVAVKEAVIRLLQYLDQQDHGAELRKANLEGLIDDAYLIHNTVKILIEANIMEKQKVSVDLVAENIVNKYVSFVLDASTKTKLDTILRDIQNLVGLKKTEINWGQLAAAAISITAVAALLSEAGAGSSTTTSSRSSTFEDKVGDFNARFGTSFNV
ncbi:MAG: toll/interleukin-1 receptor domain-containing protein [Bacteroidota bacterium]|nr:toll/interleukin-1 receptor domain-containing protein [Bacteroidota bacterium]